MSHLVVVEAEETAEVVAPAIKTIQEPKKKESTSSFVIKKRFQNLMLISLKSHQHLQFLIKTLNFVMLKLTQKINLKQSCLQLKMHLLMFRKGLTLKLFKMKKQNMTQQELQMEMLFHLGHLNQQLIK